MNEQLQNKLAEILGQIASGVKMAGDFTMTQLPDIAQQYVLYGLIKNTIFLVLFLIVIAGLAKSILWTFRRPSMEDELKGPFVFFEVLAIVGFGAFTLIQAKETLLVWFAPKVWLIKEIAGLIK